ncbi:CbiX/SirB N-terminal domain-containing protein [Roseibium aggregatum]|uniref:Cobalamin biosynthesis protein CbiX n=1 Tax=Roseibium aggregatum TaxID=187304 RepID=A0A939J6E1_9HYPH|nr:CbiX/SirB N-terminal domain-containing protein [Roseibium aggregatum]MBN9672704.1 cobalamin biosynthesis protein CbiX [Roseibium aggregatum]
MSGTRSPSRKERAIEAFIVAHGQPSEPEAGEEHLRALAQKVRVSLPDWTVRSATLALPGALERALENCGPKPLVFPVFMADGWFTQKALAGRLRGTSARQLSALGTHPELPRLAARLLRRAAERAGWAHRGFEVLLAAHGSATGSAAAACTMRFADQLSCRLSETQIRVGFLEQEPRLAEAASHCGLRTLALPLFAGAGGHPTRDVPEALDRAGFQGLRLKPLGEAYFIPDLIAHALKCAAQIGNLAA